MFPPFPQELARHYCLSLIEKIQAGQILLQQVAEESLERKGQGLMVGCLVAWDSKNQKRKLLFATSGNSKKLVAGGENPAGNFGTCQGGQMAFGGLWGFDRFCRNPDVVFVDSIVGAEEISRALAQNDRKIHLLTEKIKGLEGNPTGGEEKILAGEENLPAGGKNGTGGKNPTGGENRFRNQFGMACPEEKSSLIKIRRELTDSSLAKVFSLYNFTRFDGQKIPLNQIIKKHGGHLPPTGTGDCCAPKLLNYAFANGLEIVSMDEIYFGPDTKNKKNGQSYPPCDERCGYILPSILGLEILYRDNDIFVVNKKAGLLSVPGRGAEKSDCVESRIKNLFPDCIGQPAAHRLDMETSGILILARNKTALKTLQNDFANGQVHKKYVALLDGILRGENLRGQGSGHLELKFRLDVENRPHQIYDSENGKLGITDWKKIGVKKWRNPQTGSEKLVTKIEFSPKTGRTHQLRLAASDPHGLNLPILGDSLYGSSENGERLMLHAKEITFRHPKSREIMHFISPEEF